MILFVYVLIGLFATSKSGSEDIVFSQANNSVEVKAILIDVEGVAEKPGVYKLSLDSRLQDGLIAAGGLSAQADRVHITKNFNLATKLTDGLRV